MPKVFPEGRVTTHVGHIARITNPRKKLNAMGAWVIGKIENVKKGKYGERLSKTERTP
jgi:hypothetical protein